MTTLAADDRADLYRWVLSGVVILAAHAAIAASMWYRPPPEEAAPAAAIVIELAPVTAAPIEPPNDLMPTPEQVEPEKPPEQPEEKIVERIEPQQSEDAVLPPPPEQKQEPPPPQQEVVPPPAPAAPVMRQAAVPTAPNQGAPNTSSSTLLPQWKSEVVGMLERNKRYPAAARSHRQHGVARIAFSMDRQGNVTSTRLVASSGSSLLDQEALQIARRAQPFPPPPPELPGAEITFTVPIRFTLR
jgi:protein TonB